MAVLSNKHIKLSLHISLHCIEILAKVDIQIEPSRRTNGLLLADGW